MTESTLFMNNRSQAVRLPKSAAFPETVKKVNVVVVNRARIITPVGETWDSWFAGPDVSPDYMENRDQPSEQTREAF